MYRRTHHDKLKYYAIYKQTEDVNTLAKFILDKTTMEQAVSEGKNPAAVVFGRLGRLKGGKARAEKLSAKRRKQIAKEAG